MCSLTLLRLADVYERVDDLEELVDAAFSSFDYEKEIKVCALSKATLHVKNLLLRASILYSVFFLI